MNSYELSRNWFDWCFENPEKVTPNHTALYFFCVEHCNRLGWKQKFGLPTTMAKEAIGIRSYNTYIKTLNDLVAFGFINLIEKSKNQYSSNIVALSNFNKALDKALDKALIKHTTKQCESTSESIDSIDKQINNITIETRNNILLEKESKKSLKNDIDFAFCENSELKPILIRWLEYKKWKGQRYKGQDSVETMFKKLCEYSNNDPTMATEIIEDAIAKNYTGFFKPTKNTQNGNTKKDEGFKTPTHGGFSQSATDDFFGITR